MMTDKQIIAQLEKDGVPITAVVSLPGFSKRLAWGGEQILKTKFGDNIDWFEEKIDRTTYQEHKEKLEEDPNIFFYFYDYGFDSSYGSQKSNTLKLICDKTFNTMIDLCGGLNNYLITKENKDDNK